MSNTEDRDTACAICGHGVFGVVSPPACWRSYLAESRGFEEANGYLQIPLCIACYPEVDDLTEAQRELEHYDPRSRVRLEEEIERLLDSLTLDALLTTG